MPRGTKPEAGQSARAVAELIRRELGAQRMSMRQLATITGLGTTYIRERVTGTRSLDLDDLDTIATALGLDVEIILEQAQQRIDGAPIRSVVRMSDYRSSGTLTREEAAAIITLPHAAHSADGITDEQESDTTA